MIIAGFDLGTSMGFARLKVPEPGMRLQAKPEVVGIETLDFRMYLKHFEEAAMYAALRTQLNERRHLFQVIGYELVQFGQGDQIRRINGLTVTLITWAYENRIPVYCGTPKQLKKGVTGNGNATKEEVCAILNDRYSLSIPHNRLDESDAVSAAEYAWKVMRGEIVPKTKSPAKKRKRAKVVSRNGVE